MDYLNRIREMLEHELEQKAMIPELDMKSLECIDILLHAMKSIVTIDAMENGGSSGYSGMDGQNPYGGNPYSNADGGSYGGGSYGGGSYRMSRAGYARGDEKENLIRMMEQAMNQAPDQKTRSVIQNALANLRR